MNDFHPKISIKDFEELRAKPDFLEILNDTVQYYDKADITKDTSMKVIIPNKYNIIELEKGKYQSFCIKVFKMKSPLRGSLKIIDGYNTNYVLYCSFTDSAPGNVNGFWRKFEDTKNFEIESKNGLRFHHEKNLYCS